MSKLPLIAIVGRPNVGKSTLFNRLVGARRAIVGDEPGITRDRLYGNAHWIGHDFRVVDTGGIIPEEKDFIPSEIFRQARVALDEAVLIIMVVDGRSEMAGPDLELARLLRKTGKPLFLAVNKVDSAKQDGIADDFHRLAIRDVFPVSAEHGRGVDELLDAVVADLKARKIFTTEDTLRLSSGQAPSTEADTEEISREKSKSLSSRKRREKRGATPTSGDGSHRGVLDKVAKDQGPTTNNKSAD